MDKEDKQNWGRIIYGVVIYLAFFSMGIVIGMMLQQAITQATIIKFADNLDGVTINVDLNETEIVEGVRDIYEPYLQQLTHIANSSNNSLEDST